MSVSPSKGTTPAATEKSAFTDKEERVLKLAWLCLKSGPPDIDVDKLTKIGEFQTKKTAQNTWGVIKKKLLAMAPAGMEEDGAAMAAGGEEATPAKSTPKAKGSPRKRTKKAEADGERGDEGEVTGSPTKKPRKSPVKKGTKWDKKPETAAGIEEEATAAEDDDNINVKMEGGGN